jgi:hypothetical protein
MMIEARIVLAIILKAAKFNGYLSPPWGQGASPTPVGLL